MAPVEVSRTIVITRPRHARAFFEALVTGNPDLGRPDSVEIIFGGGPSPAAARHPGHVQDQGHHQGHGTEITINAFYRHSRIKQHLKDGRALRIETVIDSPTDLARNGLITRRAHDLSLPRCSPPGRPKARHRCAALTAIQHHIDDRLAVAKAAHGSLTDSAQPSASSTRRIARGRGSGSGQLP